MQAEKQRYDEVLIPVEQARRLLGVGKRAFYIDRIEWMGLLPQEALTLKQYYLAQLLRIYITYAPGRKSREIFFSQTTNQKLMELFAEKKILCQVQEPNLKKFIEELDKHGYAKVDPRNWVR